MSWTDLEVMEAVAHEAGEFLRGSKDVETANQKSSVKDYATIADIKASGLIKLGILEHIPGAVILSEEDSEVDRKALYDDDFTGFCIDPIDGTVNYRHGMQESAVSIGKIQNGESVAGAIYDPYKDELYLAEKGSGATLNHRAIKVSDQTDMAGAVVSFSNNYDDEAMIRNMKRHMGIYEQAGVMPWTSCPGSGVLVMTWIAAGRIDAYHQNELKPWDTAAAFLLVREAGGKAVQMSTGQDARFTDPSIIVGNPAITDQLADIFAELPPELLS